MANRLARHLLALGATKGSLVAICIEQSINRPLFMLAVMKIGAAYVPLDPEYPEARLDFILQDTQAAFLLTSASLLPKFARYQGTLLLLDDEAQRNVIAVRSGDNLLVSIQPSDLIYVIYTSGSTGKPKGVAVQHSAVLSFAESYPALTGVSERNTVIQLLSYTFDASFMDLWIPLLVGATLYLYPNNKLLGAPLLDYIRRHRIDRITMVTPTILASLPTGEAIGDLKSIGVGGEACPDNVFLYWADRVKLYNAYGPTESTIAVTCHEHRPGESVRTIGKPLPGVELHVLDGDFRELPAGEPGELFIGGSQLAKEYLHRPELTAEKFLYLEIADRRSRETQTRRLYRTGDIVRRLASDDIEFIGRNDTQLKVLEKAKRKGLPVIGIRLGFVMCHGTTGATEMNQWWGSFVRCCLALGTYPMIMGLKDQLITVDFVAKAIVHIAKNAEAVGKYFHLVPDPVHDLSVSDFFVRLNELFDLNLAPAHFRDWLKLWRDNESSPLYSLLSLLTEEVVPGKSLVEVYEMTYYFERRNTDRFPEGSGIRTPLMTRELLSTYLDYMGVSLPKAH